MDTFHVDTAYETFRWLDYSTIQDLSRTSKATQELLTSKKYDVIWRMLVERDFSMPFFPLADYDFKMLRSVEGVTTWQQFYEHLWNFYWDGMFFMYRFRPWWWRDGKAPNYDADESNVPDLAKILDERPLPFTLDNLDGIRLISDNTIKDQVSRIPLRRLLDLPFCPFIRRARICDHMGLIRDDDPYKLPPPVELYRHSGITFADIYGGLVQYYSQHVICKSENSQEESLFEFNWKHPGLYQETIYGFKPVQVAAGQLDFSLLSLPNEWFD